MILSWDYCGWEMTDTIHLRDVTAHRDLGSFLHGRILTYPHTQRYRIACAPGLTKQFKKP